MNLQPITPGRPETTLPMACIGCEKDVSTASGFADLDGEPFRAYYCSRCTLLTISRSQYIAALVERDRLESAKGGAA